MTLAAAARTRTWTEEEYLALPETKPYLELVDGQITEKCMGDSDHSFLQARLSGYFDRYTQRRKGGRIATEGRARFSKPGGSLSSFRLPDVAYYAPGVPAVVEGTKLLLPPTIAVEIRSRAESFASQRRKCRWYLENGVPECWLIDPVARTVEIFDASRDGEPLPFDGAITSRLLPGFRLKLAELFSVLDQQ